MRQLLIATAACAALLGLAGARASAQGPYARPNIGPITNPPYSPYLNLLRRGGTPARSYGGTLVQNYYGLVRPELALRGAAANLQQQIVANRQTIGGLEAAASELPATGHPTQFLNTSRYFQTRGAQGAARGPTTRR